MKYRYESGNEFDLASRLQQLLLPKSSPECSWCCFSVKNRMATGIGGDFFDFIRKDDGCQVIFLGDVTGHGIHASVVMSLLYGYIHCISLQPCSPLSAILQINHFLQSFARRSEQLDYFFSCTLFFCVIHPETLHAQYINCGHVPPMVRRNDGVFNLVSTGPPLGFFEQPDIDVGDFTFQSHDSLLLFTDGITEAANPQDGFFGRDRLKKYLLTADDDHDEFLNRLFDTLKEYEGKDNPSDDCTAILVNFNGWKPAAG